jgi:hypothetical protein
MVAAATGPIACDAPVAKVLILGTFASRDADPAGSAIGNLSG